MAAPHSRYRHFELAEDLLEEQHSLDSVVLAHFDIGYFVPDCFEHSCFEPEVRQAGHFAVFVPLVLEDSGINGVPS